MFLQNTFQGFWKFLQALLIPSGLNNNSFLKCMCCHHPSRFFFQCLSGLTLPEPPLIAVLDPGLLRRSIRKSHFFYKRSSSPSRGYCQPPGQGHPRTLCPEGGISLLPQGACDLLKSVLTVQSWGQDGTRLDERIRGCFLLPSGNDADLKSLRSVSLSPLAPLVSRHSVENDGIRGTDSVLNRSSNSRALRVLPWCSS